MPFPQGTGSEAFRSAMTDVMLPALREFAPELLIISAGFDAHHLDPLGGLQFTDHHHWITRGPMQVAGETAQGRVMSMLEGATAWKAWPAAPSRMCTR